MSYRVNLRVEVEKESFFVLGEVQFEPRVGGPDLIIDYVEGEDSVFLEYVHREEWLEQISRRAIVASAAVPKWHQGQVDVDSLKKGFLAAGFVLTDNDGVPLKQRMKKPTKAKRRKK